MMRLNTTVEKISQWLAAPLPSSNHNAALKKRQLRTGAWFTQGKEFTDWKMVVGSSFMWLHGIRKLERPARIIISGDVDVDWSSIAGCGKTILWSVLLRSNIKYKQTLTEFMS